MQWLVLDHVHEPSDPRSSLVMNLPREAAKLPSTEYLRARDGQNRMHVCIRFWPDDCMHTVRSRCIRSRRMRKDCHSAAAARGARKVEKYSCGQAGGGYEFEPVIVETYGRLCDPAFGLLARLARVAAESGKVDEGKFIENTLKDLSVALCRGNGSILAAGQKMLAQVTGHDVQPGLPHPRAELI